MIRNFKAVFAASFVGALLGIGGAANATTCPVVIALYTGCSGTPAAIAACQAQYISYHPECFGSSSNTAAGSKAIQATSLEQMLAISSNASRGASRLSAPPGAVADSGQRNGLAAGNPSGKWNVWASVAESDNKYDRGAYTLSTDAAGTIRTNKFDNRLSNLVLGGDYQWAPNMAVGFSVAFDNSRGSAASYGGAAVLTPDAAKSISSSGYSYAPYLGWQINKDLALDATVGWGSGKSTVDSTVKTDSTRFFYGANLGYAKWYGNWQVTGKGSYLFGEEKAGDSKNSGVTLANTKVTNEVGQFRLAGQASYWMNGVMPYFGLAFASDQRSSTANADQKLATEMGKNAWVWSVGANFISIKNAITGGIGYEQETGRTYSKNNKLMANINARF